MEGVLSQMFRAKVDEAVLQVQQIVDSAKQPKLAEDVSHSYADKFGLAETLTRTALASQLSCLAQLGLDQQQLAQLADWARTQTVCLGFCCRRRCTFDRKAERQESSSTKRVSQVSNSQGESARWESSLVTTVAEYFWHFQVEIELFAFAGTGEHRRLVVDQRSSAHQLMTVTDNPPYPEHVLDPKPEVNLDLTELLQWLEPDGRIRFEIDRAAARTPRRNAEIERIGGQMERIDSWTTRVRAYVVRELFQIAVLGQPALDMKAINADGIFSPVVPLFEERPPEQAGLEVRRAGGQAVSRAMMVEDLQLLLAAERKALKAKCDQMAELFPAQGSIVTGSEAATAVVLIHMKTVVIAWKTSIDYIEDMLRTQLLAAIGKTIGPDDLAEYMRFHNNKLFKPAYAPKPFAYAIRRSAAHAPQGQVGIEQTPGSADAVAQPVRTLVSHCAAQGRMRVKLSASTAIEFGGDRFVHGLLLHRFAAQPAPKLEFVARARQFSSFIVLLGRISGPASFEPTYGMVVRNMDEYKLPLDLETIPTAKQFKDAISSLSPEQQEFCKAFRGMQLESTLFGVVVIQIKPQLETVLNLAPDALAKEIQLTEQLMELFIKYQIPSDLLAFEQGEHELSERDPQRLEAVRSHVNAMYQMINNEKQRELEEKQQAERHRLARERSWERSSFEECSSNDLLECDDDGWDDCCDFGALESLSSLNSQVAMPPMRNMQARSLAANSTACQQQGLSQPAGSAKAQPAQSNSTHRAQPEVEPSERAEAQPGWGPQPWVDSRQAWTIPRSRSSSMPSSRPWRPIRLCGRPSSSQAPSGRTRAKRCPSDRLWC